MQYNPKLDLVALDLTIHFPDGAEWARDIEPRAMEAGPLLLVKTLPAKSSEKASWINILKILSAGTKSCYT